jgi:hypothetical protein
MQCKECECQENELRHRGFYTEHRGTADEHYVCIPCKEKDAPIHLQCFCHERLILGPDGHVNGCHVSEYFHKRAIDAGVIKDELATIDEASSKPGRLSKLAKRISRRDK